MFEAAALQAIGPIGATGAPCATVRTAAVLPLARLTRAIPLASLLLAGCAGIGGPARPDAATLRDGLPRLTAPVAARIEADLEIDRWWKHFDDPALSRRVEQALARNADLAVAAARLREARARFEEARGNARPALELQVSSARARASASSMGIPGVGTQSASSHQVTLVGAYEIDLWGRLAAGTEVARQRLAAQAWARASVEWSLAAQVTESHFMLRALQRKLQISQVVSTSRARTTAMRRAEHNAGAANEFDLRRAEAEQAAAETTLATLQRQRLAVAGVMALLTGEPIAALADASATDAALDPEASFQPRLPQGEMATWLHRRPDLRQAEAALAAARIDVSAARAATLPSLRLSGTVGSDVRDLSNLFSGPGFAWSLATGLAQSLFDGGRLRARVDQAEARADAAWAEYRRGVAGAVVEIREAYAALDIAQQSLAAEQQRVRALARAEALARLGQQAGVLSQLDALDAERNHFQAQLAEVDAYRERLVGQVAVFKALGGGHASAELNAAPTNE